MPKLVATISDELDKRLRSNIRTRGDLSALVADALRSYLDRPMPATEAARPERKPFRPFNFTRSQRFGRGITAVLRATADEAVVRVNVDEYLRDQFIERMLNRMYREKEDRKWPPLEHASREDLNKLKSVSLEEQAERAFYSHIHSRLEPIERWAQRHLHLHDFDHLALKLEFDEESVVTRCSFCGEISGARETCWSCKRGTVEVDEDHEDDSDRDM